MRRQSSLVSGIYCRSDTAGGPVVLAHGGAWNIPESEWPAHRDGLRGALESAAMVLGRGGSATDAATEAVAMMEGHGAFDAGRGAVLNRDGVVELDAGIMDGSRRLFGSIAGVRSFLHPIRIANRILDRGERQFCMLAGAGGEAFALAEGFEPVDPRSLICDRERLRYETLLSQAGYHTSHPFLSDEHPRGTVGCVVLDAAGRLAAATSTGGTPFRPAGRVGDSPLPGCGYYANDRGAASATGWGEAIAAMVLCKSAVDRLDLGYSAVDAATSVLSDLVDVITNRDGEGATGGLIVLDRFGNGAWAYSTPVMARGGGRPGAFKVEV